jgi:nicotinate phosphoribosyltransferase
MHIQRTSLSKEPRFSGLATDLYQLTMAAAYHAHGRNEQASFELFVRRLPPQRSYLVVAGLEQALDYLCDLSFTAEEITYLRNLPVFAHVSQAFWDYLRDFRFSGDVWAMPEGAVAFANEPFLRVTAPLIEAQLAETFLLTTLNFQTLIATKAARMVEAAQERGIIEFGARRCHSFGAAIYAARAAFIGGCIGTSNVEAGQLFDLPLYGTSAHSFIMSFEHEEDAFRAYHEVFPNSTTLLLDTYDTLHAAQLATEFGMQLRGVRLDSGDLAAQCKQVRAILDAAGMPHTKIMASGDLDEFKIAALLAAGAPFDSFGVGTELSTSRDAPALGGVYKLVELEKDGQYEPKMKLSQEKATYPYCKQVWRTVAKDGSFRGDVITASDEPPASDWPLLKPVMRDGQLLEPLPDLRTIQSYAQLQLAALPARFKALREPAQYPVQYSAELERRRLKLLQKLGQLDQK